MNYKIDLLTSWVMLLFAQVSDSPTWIKTTSYILGGLAALTVLIRFVIDWKNGKFNKDE